MKMNNLTARDAVLSAAILCPLLAFLALAGAAMMGAYVYFSPASGVAEGGRRQFGRRALRPFVKPVPARPFCSD